LDISVIIPVRNGNRTLRFCLESLTKSELPPSEVIVVDDCSREDCSDLVRSYGFKFIRVDQPREADYARNRGAEMAKGDILVFTDCDMVIQPDALGRIRKRLSNSQYAAVSGVCTPENDQENLAAQYKNLWLYFSYASSPKDFDFWISSIGAVRRDVFRSLNGFRTGFQSKYGGGDLDFGRRLKGAGWKIRLDTKIQGRHLKHYSLWSLLKNDYSRGKGWFKFAFQERILPYVIRKLRIANIYPGFILSVVISFAFFLSLALAPFHGIFVFLAVILASAYLLVNYPLLRFFRRRAGAVFALKAVPLVLADHLAAGFGVMRAVFSCLWSLVIGFFAGLEARSEFKREPAEVDRPAEG
jgi:glycosyltransferase involved in cell wall biosynthesis